MYVKQNILFVHNTYLIKGGEDAVVANELNTLRKSGYTVFYKEFTNTAIQKVGIFSFLSLTNIFFNISSFFEVFFLVKKKKLVLYMHTISSTKPPLLYSGVLNLPEPKQL